MPATDAHRELLAEAQAEAPRRLPPPRPALSARARAWLRQDALERRLLDGEALTAPTGDDLAARAWQLTRPRARARMTRTLTGVLLEAGEPAARRGAAVPVRRSEVEVARDEIARVVARLRDPRPVRARGMAMLRRLLTDGDGPLYAPNAEDELWRRVRRASIALD